MSNIAIPQVASLIKGPLIRLFGANRNILLGILICIAVIYLGLTYDTFTSFANIHAIIINISEEAIVTIGMMILLISGLFDLSVGSVFAFGGATAANLMRFHEVAVLPAVLISLTACIFIGFVNGFFIARLRANPFIVTLAMMGIVRGLTLLVAGSGISKLPDNFIKISSWKFLGIQMPFWYMLIVLIMFTVLLNKTRFFRRFYYIGGNEKAATLSGIEVVRMRIISFMLMSGLAGFAGIILTSRLSASISTLGLGLELRSITASIIGGASLMGGVGNIFGAFLGTLFMGLANNFMVTAKIDVSWQIIIISSILLFAVTMDALVKKSQVKR